MTCTFKQYWLTGLSFHFAHLKKTKHQQQRPKGVDDVVWKLQEGHHPAGEEALHPDAEPGSPARKRLPQHETSLL